MNPDVDPLTRTVSIHDAACEAHKTHKPKPVYLELHHIIPRGWQYAWTPKDVDIPTDYLWAPQTVALCRTGHGNVHYALTQFMHSYFTTRTPETARMMVLRELKAEGLLMGWTEFNIAYQAMTDWTVAGGSLDFLVDNGHWGQI